MTAIALIFAMDSSLTNISATHPKTGARSIADRTGKFSTKPPKNRLKTTDFRLKNKGLRLVPWVLGLESKISSYNILNIKISATTPATITMV